VLQWITGQARATLYSTSVNKAEILYGIASLPEGRRRSALAQAAEAMFTEDFVGRILPFDERAAVRYTEIVVIRRRAGSPIEAFDAQIAAIALASEASIATRDILGFKDCGLTLINPWT
jgi:predicted nucleic acid-binding protein